MADDLQQNPEDDILGQALSNLEAEDNGQPYPITAYNRPATSQGGGQAPQDDGAFAAGERGFGDSVTFGLLDELGGVADTLGATAGRDSVFNSNQSFSALLAGNIAKNRAILKGDSENHFGATLTGQLVGGLAIPFGAGARGALQVAKVGAVQGALYGVGSGEGIEGRATEAVKDAAIGGVLGGVLGKVTEAAGAGIRKVLGKGQADVEVLAADGTKIAETAPEGISAQQATVAGPDGTSYASKLDDGSEIAGFDKDGGPVYHAAEEAAPKPTLVDDTPVPLEAPPATPDGVPTPMGSMGRSQLDALVADVERFKANPDLPADAPQGQWSIGSLGSNEQTTGLLSALARQLPASIRRTDQELSVSAGQVAASIGEDPDAMLAWAKAAAGTLGDVDNTMMALRSVWSQAGKQVSELHLAGVDWGTADDAIVAQAGQAIRNLSELSQQVQIAKAGLGRGLRVNQLPDAETYLKTLLAKGEAGEEAAAGGAAKGGGEAVKPVGAREAPPLPRNRQELKDWFDLWGMHEGNPKGQADMLQGLLTVPTPGKYLRTSVANFFTASILSAPKTVALNVVGPAFISLIRNGERMGGAAAGALNPFASAEERAAMREVARQTPIAYFQTLGDIGDALRYGMQAARENRSVLGGGSSTTDALASYGPLTNNLLGAAGADPSLMYQMGNLINVFPKAFGRLNNGLDETAKRLAYMGEVRVRAQVEAAQQGLSGDAFMAHVRDKLKNSTDEVGHAQDEAMLRSAERTTFTAQVGPEGSWARRFGNGVQALRRDIPEMRFIMPVFNVPANSLAETFRRVPLANRFIDSHAKDLAGENGVVAQAEAHGRTLMGASFLMAGVMMNRLGILTGAGPQEATDRKVWLQTHQPYSIRVGDEWVRYDKYDILGGLLAIPSTITDASTYRAADQGVGDMMLAGAGAMAQWFKDKAALRTATALLNAGSDPTSDFGTVVSSFAASTAAGFIPAVGRTLTVDTTDPYVRLRRDWTDYMKASLPGLSQTLEPTRNVLGEPIHRSADTFAEALFPVTMQSAVSYKEDPVMDELGRLYQTTGYGAGADPKSLGYGFFNPKDVKLEDGRSIYDRAMQKRMTMVVDGLTLKDRLRQVIDSEAYNKGVDADPNQKVTSLGDASRGYMVRQVFDQYNKASKAELAGESPIADSYLTAAAAKQRDDAYLRDVSAEDLVKTPRLYQDRGINPGAYSEKIKGTGGGSDPLMAALGL